MPCAGGWHDRTVPRRNRVVIAPRPAETGTDNGLAYSLWLPDRGQQPHAGVVILHGAGSCKESHHDFARAAIAAGLAAIVFDQRGHGESDGPMDGRVVQDVASITARLRGAIGDPDAPVALRGSSMGGYLAIIAAPAVAAAVVVAICPASAEGMLRGLAAGTLRFDADASTLASFLSSHDLGEAVDALEVPLLILHSEGDEQVPVEQSRELEPRMRAPGSRLIVLPGGHHRSIQHDEELQAVSLRFIERALV
jgi:alpha-beta hydrolase superfamily lysophospholipase